MKQVVLLPEDFDFDLTSMRDYNRINNCPLAKACCRHFKIAKPGILDCFINHVRVRRNLDLIPQVYTIIGNFDLSKYEEVREKFLLGKIKDYIIELELQPL
jgi:hypothetical protein